MLEPLHAHEANFNQGISHTEFGLQTRCGLAIAGMAPTCGTKGSVSGSHRPLSNSNQASPTLSPIDPAGPSLCPRVALIIFPIPIFVFFIILGALIPTDLPNDPTREHKATDKNQ